MGSLFDEIYQIVIAAEMFDRSVFIWNVQIIHVMQFSAVDEYKATLLS